MPGISRVHEEGLGLPHHGIAGVGVHGGVQVENTNADVK